jgi:hypothetical protein
VEVEAVAVVGEAAAAEAAHLLHHCAEIPTRAMQQMKRAHLNGNALHGALAMKVFKHVRALM